MFHDEATIEVRSGKGGPGCASFRREKFVPRGGPDGGNGGDGGSVFIRAESGLTSLADLGRRRHYIAENGRQGMGNNRSGRRGKDLYVPVPIGTIVREIVDDTAHREGYLLGDLTEENAEVIVARGGRGGQGNKAFVSPTKQVPRHAQPGLPGESRKLYLELKLMADVGLVGLPNAGKSTLLSRVSSATPKIADYPFTTLKPVLGLAELGDFRRLVFADIPGLIEGAHLGQGLGIEFLRHIERTGVLVHLVSAEESDPENLYANYQTIEAELSSYSEILAKKPRIVALSKIDTVLPEELEELIASMTKLFGCQVLPFSSVTGKGIPELLRSALQLVDSARETIAIDPVDRNDDASSEF